MSAKDYYLSELLQRVMGYDPVLNLSSDSKLLPREPLTYIFQTQNPTKNLTLRITNTKDEIRIMITDAYGCPYVIRSWHVIYDNDENDYAKLRSE